MKKLKNVLLVDDDSITNFINKSIISDIEVSENIYTAENGMEALEILKSHCQEKNISNFCPSIVFLDLNMPLMDGFEFLQMFGNMNEFENQCIPIIVLTSSENAQDIQKAKQLKVNGYVCKPLTAEKVTDVINEIFV